MKQFGPGGVGVVGTCFDESQMLFLHSVCLEHKGRE